MCRHCISRRELLGIGLGAAAGLLALPHALRALETETSDIDVALKAARWIRKSRITTPNGVAWPADPLKPKIGFDLYNGFPGVILFHLELYHATHDKQWLDEAKLGANELIAQLPAMDAAKASGLYEGLAGAVFVLESTYRISQDDRYRHGAKRALDLLHAQAQHSSTGAFWTGSGATNDIISGTAGIGLTLIWADHYMDEPSSRTLALLAGRHLLETGVPDKGGTKWNVAPSVTNLYPNFSHGTAGVAYFLATLLRASGDRSFMAAALAGAKYLEDVANTENGGFKVFHHEPGGEDLYYLSWCHGPAGTSRLFQRLDQITQRPKWQELVKQAARATIDSGVPEKQSPGYWDNISQCCGNCGVGEFFIALQRQSPDPAYAKMIDRVRVNTLARATADGAGLKWIQAENRVSPRDVVAQTGYMQGAAGVGSFYLHADGLAKNRAPAVIWPDSMAFEPCVRASQTGMDMSGLNTTKASCS